MKIAIDARFVGPEQTGLGRYTEELLSGLAAVDGENEYALMLSRDGMKHFTPQAKNFTKVEADFAWYSVDEQKQMPKIIAKINPDLVHFCHFNVPLTGSTGWWGQRPFVVTIHDLIKGDFKGKDSTTKSSLVYNLKHWGYETVIGHAIKGAGHILTPSYGTKQKIIEKYKVSGEKITVTHEAADPRFAKYRDIELSEDDKKHLADEYNIKYPFILYVGNAYPYKNLDRLLRALRKIDPAVSFVNPCARSIFYDRLKDKAQELGLAKRVILPGFVPDEDLAKLYRAAELYAFPSLSEGFGLPALEAQMAGLPLVMSLAAPLPEIGGDGALYFDPYSVDDIAAKINMVLAKRELRSDLISKGVANTKRFNWEKTAVKTLNVYNKFS